MSSEWTLVTIIRETHKKNYSHPVKPCNINTDNFFPTQTLPKPDVLTGWNILQNGGIISQLRNQGDNSYEWREYSERKVPSTKNT